MHNHLDQNYNLCSKKYLYLNLKSYCLNNNECINDYLPRTFHIKNGNSDQEFKNFLNYFN